MSFLPITSLHIQGKVSHWDHSACSSPLPPPSTLHQDFNFCASSTFVMVPWPLLTTSWAGLITSLNDSTSEILVSSTHSPPHLIPPDIRWLPPSQSHLLSTSSLCFFAVLFHPRLCAQSAHSFASYLLSLFLTYPCPFSFFQLFLLCHCITLSSWVAPVNTQLCDSGTHREALARDSHWDRISLLVACQSWVTHQSPAVGVGNVLFLQYSSMKWMSGTSSP